MGSDANIEDNTGLVLGLGIPSPADNHKDYHDDDQFGKRSGPSLTLTLSGNHKAYDLLKMEETESSCKSQSTDLHVYLEAVQKHRGFGAFGPSVHEDGDKDDEGSNGRKKLRLSKGQSAVLEESFKQQSTLNPKKKQELAKELKLKPRQVEVWFQNRRARTKLKQTEVDCEALKKCCETLTHENRRLHKELQQLKSLKFAAQYPFPTQPQVPATVTMCPSCERIGGATTVGGGATKPHFYNPFANSSAAC